METVMPKQRNRYLGDAEIPRSVQDFFAEQGGISVKLLLNYIEELERQNKQLHDQRAELRKELEIHSDRIDALETIVERLKGLRVLKPLTPEERAEREAIKNEKLEQQPWKKPRGGFKKAPVTKGKGWTRESGKRS